MQKDKKGILCLLNVNDFGDSIYTLMDSSRYDEAKQIILENLKEIQSDKEANIILLAEIAGFLIDIEESTWTVVDIRYSPSQSNLSSGDIFNSRALITIYNKPITQDITFKSQLDIATRGSSLKQC